MYYRIENSDALMSPRGRAQRARGTAVDSSGRDLDVRSLYDTRPDALYLNSSGYTRPDHVSKAHRRRSPDLHRREAQGLSVPQRRLSPMSDATAAAPMRRIYEEAAYVVSEERQLAALDALLALSTPVRDIATIADLPSASRSSALWDGRRLAAIPLAKPRYSPSPSTMTSEVMSAPQRKIPRPVNSMHIPGDTSNRYADEIRRAVSYEKRLALKGLFSVTLIAFLMAMQAHFFG